VVILPFDDTTRDTLANVPVAGVSYES
jgi:hypothetical protein